MRRHFFCLLLLSLVFVPSVAQEREPREPNLIGIYEMQGVTEEGEAYSGIVIIKKRGIGYAIQWTRGLGNNIVGVGAVHGDWLHCSWNNEVTVGMTLYKLNKDNKTLPGKWMHLGHPEAWQEETLKYLRPWPEPKERK